MDATEILCALRSDGIELTADGGDILIEPGDRLTDQAAELIRANKSELLELLHTEAPAPISDDERERLTCWLAWIGEDDPAVLAAFWKQVSRDPEARRYFLGVR